MKMVVGTRTRWLVPFAMMSLAITAPARAEPSSTSPAPSAGSTGAGQAPATHRGGGSGAPTSNSAAPSTAAPVVPPAPAKREPSAGDLATARTALREGLALRENGDRSGALMRLSSAYDLVQTPVTGFELGKTHLLLGHVLQAHELFKKVVRMPPSMEESTRSQTARDEAARLAKEIEPRIPSLRLKLMVVQGASAVVRVDDDVITMTGSETMRAVDPGPHDIIAKAGDGPEEKVHVEVAEAETKDVVLAPQWVEPKSPTQGANGNQEIFVRSTNPLVYIGFGVAAAAAVVSGVTAFVALKTHDDARDQCGKEFCPPRSDALGGAKGEVPDLEFTDTNRAAAFWTVVSVVAGATTVVFTGVGVFGIRRPIKERVVSMAPASRSPTVRPLVGLSHFGVAGTF